MIPTLPYRPLIEAIVATEIAELVGIFDDVKLPPWHYRGRRFSAAQLFEALVWTESSGQPKARRYEPHQDRATRRDAPADPDRPEIDDGDVEDDASYGLTQVMGYNLRALVGVQAVALAGSKLVPRDVAAGGVFPPMRFGWALDPVVNVRLGLRVLAGEIRAVRLEERAGKTDPGETIERALARYNGGPTGDDGRPFRLAAYVEKVHDRALRIVGART